jgi:hypothetical protein
MPVVPQTPQCLKVRGRAKKIGEMKKEIVCMRIKRVVSFA